MMEQIDCHRSDSGKCTGIPRNESYVTGAFLGKNTRSCHQCVFVAVVWFCSRQIRDRSSVALDRGDKQPYLLTDTIERMDVLMH